MITSIFWNFRYDHPDQEAVAASLALSNGADILILAEAETTDPVVLLSRLKGTEPAYEYTETKNRRFKIFTKFPIEQFIPYRDHERMSVHRLRIAGRQEIIFAIIHFYDRMRHDRDVQHSRSSEVYQTLRMAELDAGHCRTIVVGDFNMNPFDKGMVDSNIGFGAMMSRSLALRHSAAQPGGSQRFYNPMWARLGRELPEPPGTYYWPSKSDPLNLYWHSLDQVLIRPDLLDAFRDEDFRILTSIPSSSNDSIELVRNTGKHWKIRVSDHLPILFKLSPPLEQDNA